MLVVSALYACKLVFFLEAVRREYYHPICANFFFAPWIVCLFLAIGVPEAETLPHWLWYLLMAPILFLELKIYSQWISGGQRRLLRVANPSNHMSAVGNFVGVLLGGIMGLNEWPLLFFAVGLTHYMVLFVTLHRRVPTSEMLPRTCTRLLPVRHHAQRRLSCVGQDHRRVRLRVQDRILHHSVSKLHRNKKNRIIAIPSNFIKFGITQSNFN
jgi:hypothetical protein